MAGTNPSNPTSDSGVPPVFADFIDGLDLSCLDEKPKESPLIQEIDAYLPLQLENSDSFRAGVYEFSQSDILVDEIFSELKNISQNNPAIHFYRHGPSSVIVPEDPNIIFSTLKSLGVPFAEFPYITGNGGDNPSIIGDLNYQAKRLINLAGPNYENRFVNHTLGINMALYGEHTGNGKQDITVFCFVGFEQFVCVHISEKYRSYRYWYIGFESKMDLMCFVDSVGEAIKNSIPSN